MKYLFSVISLIIYLEGISQSFPYTFQTWDVTNGLSSNYCNAVVQNADGYLYVATNSGLYVFNGNYFKPLSRETEPVYIGEGNVEDVTIDIQNRIWFASIERGVGMVDPNEPNFKVSYFSPKKSVTTLSNDSLYDAKVSKLCFDSKGFLWVGTRGDGLYKLDTATKKFTTFETDNKSSLYNKYIRSLFFYKPDTLFVGMINGLSIVNPLDNSIIHKNMIDAETKKSIRPTVRKVLPWNTDSFLLATDRGTFWLQISTGQLSSIYKDNITKIDFEDVNSNDILKFSDQEIWIATENEGIIFFNVKTKQFSYSYKLSEYKPCIPKGFISRFTKDALNNIWIAQQNGVSLFQSYNVQFRGFAFEDKEPFAGSLLARDDNLICIKSNSIATMNTLTGKTKVKNISTLKRKDVIPSSVVPISSEDFLLFLFDSIFAVNYKTLASRYMPLNRTRVDSTVFKHFRVTACIPDTLNGKREYLLFTKTMMGNILLNYFPEDGLLTDFIPDGFKKEDFKYGFTKVVKTGNGKYWISTLYNGLIYTEKNGKSIQYSAGAAEENRKIPPGEITDFALTSDNNVWLLINKTGLIHLNPNTRSARAYKIYAEEQGLLDKRLYNIITDLQDNLWLTSNSGLFCFRTVEKEFLRYSAANGLGNIKFQVNEVELAKTTNGYIGLSDKYTNLTWFKPEDIYKNAKPNLILHSLKINDSIINLKTIHSTLHLSPNQNNISFQHDIIDFDKTTFYKVMFRLDNFDNRWYYSNYNNEQRYMQLPAGKYTFRIKLQHPNGEYSNEKNFSFIIETIWYKTWWFKSIITLLCLCIIYFSIKFYINRKLYKQKKELELQNAVALERARISTELHDDLGGGLSTIRILSEANNHLNGRQPSNENLVKISKHSKELLQKMTEIVWALNIKNDTFDQLLSYIRLQTVQTLDETGIQYKIEMPENIPPIMINGINRRHLMLLIKEAIHNIVKHAQANFVDIRFALVADQLTLIVHDNGIGIDEIMATLHKGNGLHTMQQHALALGGILKIEKKAGTCVSFCVPINKISYESVISNKQNHV